MRPNNSFSYCGLIKSSIKSTHITPVQTFNNITKYRIGQVCEWFGSHHFWFNTWYFTSPPPGVRLDSAKIFFLSRKSLKNQGRIVVVKLKRFEEIRSDTAASYRLNCGSLCTWGVGVRTAQICHIQKPEPTECAKNRRVPTLLQIYMYSRHCRVSLILHGWSPFI